MKKHAASQTSGGRRSVGRAARTAGKNKIPKGPDRKPAIQAAKLLDQYNNGIVGPGHCDEQ